MDGGRHGRAPSLDHAAVAVPTYSHCPKGAANPACLRSTATAAHRMERLRKAFLSCRARATDRLETPSR
ncbi:hypothetical protein HMPREF0762_00944 [Slackia exigua ATCC 700122]|uniref:Uncharacterized protein n=1 Tax=Slackia exigua (strain ATCC 700122 / DSM 15923 / CIP 105133 / JCM 11022 / KCTC 5966 / S-7) TaxID=649764 RepID=D0WGJ0_SLAES|nr:hypothetical protein HMPREF0762_00944 [Slackia exigua ATCC 700122]